VARHLHKAPVVLTLLASEDQIDRSLEVIVDAASRHSTPQLKRAPMRIEHHLLRLAQVRHREEDSAVAQAQMGNLHRLHLTTSSTVS